MIVPSDRAVMDQDLELVDSFRRGSIGAFDILFAHYKDVVYSLVLRTVGSGVADDVSQEVFLQVLRSLSGFQGESSLRTWIYRITVNVCKQHIRRMKTRPTVCSDDCKEAVSEAPEPFVVAVDRWLASRVERQVDCLPEMERLAIELHYTQGLSYREMAEVLRCPAGTVKARVHLAIKKLRQQLQYLAEDVDSDEV